MVGNNNLLTINGAASGKVCSAANGNRRCRSAISADQWEADTHVLFGVVWE